MTLIMKNRFSHMDPKAEYDIHSEVEVLKRAARLVGTTLNTIFGEAEFDKVGGKGTKGMFGQIVEKEYFHIDNNNDQRPDFFDLGIELKTHPMVKRANNELKAKERLVLGIINYIKADREGFDTFKNKNSRLLVLFYLWMPEMPIGDYSFLKAVDWVPTPAELQMIREDWEVIHGFIHRGEAHLLSERYTKVLAANTKGMGHGKDMRKQPHSDEPAPQRSLSFKAAFMTTMYHSRAGISEAKSVGAKNYAQVFTEGWAEGMSFESAVLARFQRFVGMTGYEIETILGINLGYSKQYYSALCNNMLGATGKKHVKELVEADVAMKTVRIRLNGKPKECMSFPHFVYEDIVKQEWDESDFKSHIDRLFLFPVFSFNTDKPELETDCKALVFKGAFFWKLSDEEFEKARNVWEDTKNKTEKGRIKEYVRISDNRMFHVRTHGRNSADTLMFRGEKYVKRGFWINDSNLKNIISEGLYGENSTKR